MYRVSIYDRPDDGVGTIIHSPYVNSQKISSGNISQVIEGMDTMDFTINPKNAGWGKIKPLTTLIRVVNIKTRLTEFEGRILKPKQSMSIGGLFNIQYNCESFLSYLLDSSQRHGEYRNMTITEFLQVILNNHNSQVEAHKRFKLGNVTVTNSTDNVYRYLGYENTYDSIKDKLINRLGGYLVVRNEEDGLYLDYLEKVGKLSTTTIKFKRNMKEMSREIDPTEIITRLVPLGAQIDSDDPEATDASKARIDIKSVNGGKDYIDDPELIAEFGIIEGTLLNDDVHQPSILKTRGQQFLDTQKASRNGFELTPLDLSLNGIDKESINRGDWYNVDNPIFTIKEPLQVVQKDINIVSPLEMKITIGDKFKTLTQYQIEVNKGVKKFDELERSVANQSQTIGALKQQLKNVNTLVDNVNNEINEADLPGLKVAINDLNNALIDLNHIIEGIPSYGIATPTQTGLMSMYDKSKLDSLENYQLATGTIDGLLSKEDKQKINRITANQTIDLDQFMSDFLALKETVGNTV